MNDLKELFSKAVKEAQDPLNDSSGIKNMQKLELYAFFKQATEGPCKGQISQIKVQYLEELLDESVNVQIKAKYNFWKKLGNLEKEEAMKEYIKRVKQLYPEFEKKLYQIKNEPKL